MTYLSDHLARAASQPYYAGECSQCRYWTVPTSCPDRSADALAKRCSFCGGPWVEHRFTPAEAEAWERGKKVATKRRPSRDGGAG